MQSPKVLGQKDGSHKILQTEWRQKITEIPNKFPSTLHQKSSATENNPKATEVLYTQNGGDNLNQGWIEIFNNEADLSEEGIKYTRA